MDGKILIDIEILNVILFDLVIFLLDGIRIYNKSVFEWFIEDFFYFKFF